jgi:hypothetical protein
MVRKLFFEESPLTFQKHYQHTAHGPALIVTPSKSSQHSFWWKREASLRWWFSHVRADGA